MVYSYFFKTHHNIKYEGIGERLLKNNAWIYNRRDEISHIRNELDSYNNDLERNKSDIIHGGMGVIYVKME